MKYYIFALFWLLLTLTLHLGDVLGLVITVLGFLIILYFAEDMKNE